MSHRDVQYLSVGDAEAVQAWPVGTFVRLKPEECRPIPADERPIARITGYLVGIRGGVSLSPKLEGLSCWNIEALEKA